MGSCLVTLAKAFTAGETRAYDSSVSVLGRHLDLRIPKHALKKIMPSKMTSNTEKDPQQTLQSVEGHARSDADAALEMLREHGSQTEILDPEKHRQLVRRIDLHIMPLICIVYCELSPKRESVKEYCTFTNALSSPSIS